ncbi:RDD family protein [Mucilaginibacter lappiensis]|uniref:Putative RDD family membrane protein YckC n=1 Tax=Mucilaginibacter lappiensis TaxID=354630 RepID=A0A841JQ73_9SPHI|nr:RDD family protein [Mucilaginibacter lappiensis]MBB6131756.1 putative RDD family membrane protein YckC [Mucilaginibacter lappiensis]
MINEYYILRDNEKHGPYSHIELMDMEVNATELVLSPLATDWQEAFELPEFDEYFKSIGIYAPTTSNVANFGWRLLAFVIDYVIITIGLGLTVGIFVAIGRLTTSTISMDPLSSTSSTEGDLLFRLIFLLILTSYNSTFEATKMQGSIGKFICRLVVVNINGQRLSFGTALSRNLLKILSSFLFFLGYFAMLWSPMKQCWHDQRAKTYVVRKPK